MNIVLYGSEELLLSQRLTALEKEYGISEEEMNLTTYYLDETPMTDVLADALTQPLFTQYKMVILRHPFFLTSAKQKNVSEKDVEGFIDYISHDNPSTILVIYHNEARFDERKKAMKALRKNARFIELNELDTHTVYKTVREAVISRGSAIDDDALELLLSRTGSSLAAAHMEVDKLCLYTKHITREAVEQLVPRPLEENVFALTNAIMRHDLVSVSVIYQDLMLTNHEPIQLIGLIANSMRQIYQVKLLERKGYTDKEMVKILGINPRAIYPIRKNARAFAIDELEEKLNELSDLDISIKTGRIDKKRGLELFLMRI